jgi:predicted phosphodiesterase
MKFDYIKINRENAIIGDVHGCHTLLIELLAKLEANGVKHFVFLGDLVDRGPHPFEVVETVNKLVVEGKATALVGNHDWKILRHLDGKDVRLGEDQIATFEAVGKHRLHTFKNNYLNIFKDMNVFLLDTENKFMVSHAIAMRPKKVYDIVTDPTRTMAKWFWTGFLYGKSDGNDVDERGYPKRLPITYHEYDDLDGWRAIVGHYHANNLYLEKGNKNVMCADFCAGEGGNLAALTFTEDLTPQLVFSDSKL